MEIIQHLILVVISHTVAYLSRWHQKQCKDLHVFDNLESGNCFRKAWKESGILGPRVCTNPVFTVVQSSNPQSCLQVTNWLPPASWDSSSSSSSLSLFTYLFWFICVMSTNGVWMGIEYNMHVNPSKNPAEHIYKNILFQPKNPRSFLTDFKTSLLLFCCDLRSNLVCSVYEYNNSIIILPIYWKERLSLLNSTYIMFSICTSNYVNIIKQEEC